LEAAAAERAAAPEEEDSEGEGEALLVAATASVAPHKAAATLRVREVRLTGCSYRRGKGRWGERGF
jgi:hypothetical protein